MTIETDIAALTTSTNSLTTQVNAKKTALNTAVTTADTYADATAPLQIAASASATQAATSSTAALTVYGSLSAQQAAVSTSAGHAYSATASAASASVSVLQDLSGVNTAALHRSPYGVASMFVYDTSKDTDGGAWTEKCQHTSWYNENITGKWITSGVVGGVNSEAAARALGGTLGPNLMAFANGTLTGWTPGGTTSLSIEGNFLRLTNTTGGAQANWTQAVTPNKPYLIKASGYLGTSTGFPTMRVSGDSGGTWNVLTSNSPIGCYVIYPTTSSLIIQFNNQNTQAGWSVLASDFSLQEVISFASSNDYFQLNTDGKFYRLWKNLFRWSEDFNNAAWQKVGITVSPTQFLAPDGTTTADLIYPTTSGTRYVNQDVTGGIVGDNNTYTVYLKSSGLTKAYIYTVQGNALAYFDLDANSVLSTPAVGVGGFVSASIRDAGNGWRACTVVSALTVGGTRTTAVGPCDANGSNTVTANGTNGILIWGAQLEVGSVATAYEAKTTAGTTSEVFRGNKRDFPRLAGIVCQSTGSNAAQVAIYDLTEPGRPMWMSFVDYSLRSTTIKLLDWNGDDSGWSHVAMMNGWLIGTSSVNMGMCHFIKDWIAGGNGFEFSRNRVSDRNDVGTVTSTGRLTFNTAQSNSARTIQMLVEPNAPVEPETGLPRPSVLIGSTQPTYNSPTGGSFLYHTSANYDDVVLFPKLIAARRGFNSFSPNFFYTINPGLPSAVSGEITATSAPDFALGGNTAKLIGAANGEFLRAPAASLVQKLKLNTSAVAKSLTTTIRDTFNTGWMPGDIRRAYLADADVGAVSGNELITNGSFDTNINGWFSSRSGVLSHDNGTIRIASGGLIYGKANQIISTVVGKFYELRFTLITGTTVGAFVVSASLDGFEVLNRQNLASGTYRFIFQATSTTTYIGFQNDPATVGVYFNIDNVSIKEAIFDRSYKSLNSRAAGLVVKSQVATGSSLVAYSGWSTLNYLQEPYSADLDFGTGEFSASAWVNAISAPRRNLLIWTESFDNAVWLKSETTVPATQFLAPDGTTTAKTLIPTTVSGQHYAYVSATTTATPYTISIYAKANGYDFITLMDATVSQARTFNLSNGTKGGVAGQAAPVSDDITPVGNGWYRCSITVSPTAAAQSIRVYVYNADSPTAWSGNGTSGVLIWGAQFETGSTATAYQRVFAAYDVNDAVDLPLGPELVTNGGFATDTGWTKGSGWTISGGVANANVTGYSNIVQSISAQVGKTYVVSLTVTVTSGAVAVGFGTNGQNVQNQITTSGVYRLVVTPAAGTANGDIYFRGQSGGAFVGSIDNISVKELKPFSIVDRSHTSGTALRLGMMPTGLLVAEAFDGTTTRFVISSSAYNLGQWLKAEANYTTDGSLAIKVNGREVAVTRGNPLLTLNSRYNLMNWSENVNSWSARAAVTVTSFQTALSANSQFSSLVVPTNTSSRKNAVNQVYGLSTSAPCTITFLVKANGYTKIAVSDGQHNSIPAQVLIFNLSNGTVTGAFGGATTGASITSLGSNVFQCKITYTPSGVTTYLGLLVCPVPDTGVTHDYGGPTFTGDGTSGAYFGEFQVLIGSVEKPYQRTSLVAETNVAPLTIGNNFTADAPFPGSIALLKLSATVPTPEQSVFMYEQEKQLFRPGAISVLPDANAIVDMSYDDATDRWAAISTTNESYWTGLVRSSATAVPSGSYSKITTTSGIELSARTTTNPGVDISIPAYGLREQLEKRAEGANKLSKPNATYDFVGGFTATTTLNSTAITSVASLTYPTSYIGARISGSGIPANTYITGVSGTTIYISAPATATASGVSITFLDFNLPIGMEARLVLTAGVLKQEGATKDYTRLFDGFIETIRFATAPGATAWVQIQATKGTIQ